MAQQMDNKHFEEILKEYKTMVLRTANLILHDNKEAEDASQEVFIRIYRFWNTFDSQRGSLKSWICRIIANECITRRKKNSKSFSLDELMDEGYIPASKDMSPEQQAVNTIFTHQLMSSLDSKYRSILVMRFFNGLSYQEIADILEIPLGTVKTRISSAIITLRKNQSSGQEKVKL